MNRVLRLAVSLSVSVGLMSTAGAAVPHLVRYQGTAVDANNVPLEGPYNLTFRLYTAAAAGTVVWQEPHNNIPLTKGRFSVLLGNGTPPTPLNVDWSVPLWISIQVGTDPELSPRQQITSVPLAIRAETLDTPVTTSNITDDANKLVPTGAIILWNGAACPAGYSRVTTLDGKFLVGGASYNNAAGGTNTQSLTLSTTNLPAHTHDLANHTHSLTPHTHDIEVANQTAGGATEYRVQWQSSSQANLATAPSKALSGGGGNTGGPSPTVTGSTGSSQPITFDNRPAFATVLLCQKN